MIQYSPENLPENRHQNLPESSENVQYSTVMAPIGHAIVCAVQSVKLIDLIVLYTVCRSLVHASFVNVLWHPFRKFF